MVKQRNKVLAVLTGLVLSITVQASDIQLGKITVDSNIQTVSISGFTDPVIIAGVPSINDEEPGTISISNVKSDSFDINFKEWTYLDGVHGYEQLPYMVLEKGRHVMADGSIWEVGILNQHLGDNEVYFSQPFTGTPIVLLTTQSQIVSDTHAVRAKSVTRFAFSSHMFEQESHTFHGVEKIGYVAIYHPKGAGKTDEGFGYIATTEIINNSGYTGTFGTLVMQEEQSKDSETTHKVEVLGVLEINGLTFASDNSLYGGDSMTLRYTPEYEVIPAEQTGSNGNIALVGTNNLQPINYLTSQAYPGDTAEAAFDGYILGLKVNPDAGLQLNRGTWISYASSPQWLQVDFGKKAFITGFSTNTSTGYPTRSPKDVIIQTSDDGVNFTDQEEFTLQKGTANVSLSSPAIGQFIRLKVLSNYGDSYIQIGELEYYGNFIQSIGEAPTEPSLTAEISCKAILEKAPDSSNGTYLLDPDGTGIGEAFSAYCDMTSNGGGWTRVGNFYSVTDLGPYTSNPAQVSNPDALGWHIAFSKVMATEVMINSMTKNLAIANQTLDHNLSNTPVTTIVGTGQLTANTIYINTELRSTCDGTYNTNDPSTDNIYNNDYVGLGIYENDSQLSGSLCFDYFAYGDAWGRKDSIHYSNLNYGSYTNWQGGIWVR